jgi:hypothetical protein
VSSGSETGGFPRHAQQDPVKPGRLPLNYDAFGQSANRQVQLLEKWSVEYEAAVVDAAHARVLHRFATLK